MSDTNSDDWMDREYEDLLAEEDVIFELMDHRLERRLVFIVQRLLFDGGNAKWRDLIQPRILVWADLFNQSLTSSPR